MGNNWTTRWAALAVAAAVFGLHSPALAAELNLYSSRHYDTDERLYSDFEEMTGITINRIEGKADELIARMQAANTPLGQLLGEMRGYLNPQGTELIIRAAWQIALSDGEFHETERALLWEVAQGLGMTPAHFKGLISELMGGELPATPPPIPGAN